MSEIKPYGKTELAYLYGIHRNTLMRWIQKKILSDLIQTGYYTYQKVFTTKQIEIIFNEFGVP